jgi:tellurite resistance protein TehA-like permease
MAVASLLGCAAVVSLGYHVERIRVLEWVVLAVACVTIALALVPAVARTLLQRRERRPENTTDAMRNLGLVFAGTGLLASVYALVLGLLGLLDPHAQPYLFLPVLALLLLPVGVVLAALATLVD